MVPTPELAARRPKSLRVHRAADLFYRNVEDSSFPGERPQTILLGNTIQAKFLYVASDRAKEISVSFTILLELF